VGIVEGLFVGRALHSAVAHCPELRLARGLMGAAHLPVTAGNNRS